MREVELKFEVGDSFDIPRSWPETSGVTTVQELPPQELRARYFDTTDRRLARHKVTLRHRTGDDSGPCWTLKLPASADGSERDEVESPGSPARPPRDIRALVRAMTLDAELRPLATVKTTRRRWAVQGDGGAPLAEIARDDVVILRDRKVVDRFEELELESKGASREVLESIAEGLGNAGASPASYSSKGLRAVGADGDAPAPSPRKRISPKEPASATVRNAIVAALRRLQANDPQARLGSAEGVHQMRVAARHLRSDLQTFDSLVDPEWASAITSELRWLGTLLGEVRDLDVLKEKLRGSAAGLEEPLEPLFEELDSRGEVARSRALAELNGDRYLALVAALDGAATDPPSRGRAADPGGHVLVALAARRWKSLAKAVAKLDDHAPSDKWHKVRIRAKRARYAAEAVAGSIGRKAGKDAEVFARLCSKVQDALGDRQDAFVAIDTIKRFADERYDDGPFNRAAGRLLERQWAKADDAREAFWRQWDRIDRKKNVAWLKSTAH